MSDTKIVVEIDPRNDLPNFNSDEISVSWRSWPLNHRIIEQGDAAKPSLNEIWKQILTANSAIAQRAISAEVDSEEKWKLTVATHENEMAKLRELIERAVNQAPSEAAGVDELSVRGVGASADDQRSLVVHFDRIPSDDNIRLVHDVLREGLRRGDAYRGARDDMLIWKKRALEAEQTIRRMAAEFNSENGPTFMGEPVAQPPAAPERGGWVVALKYLATFMLLAVASLPLAIDDKYDGTLIRKIWMLLPFGMVVSALCLIWQL